jgi:hypothetical protein
MKESDDRSKRRDKNGGRKEGRKEGKILIKKKKQGEKEKN